MVVRENLSVMLSFLRYFFFRFNLTLFAYLLIVVFYTVTFVGSFVVIFRALAAFIAAGAPVTDPAALIVDLPYLPPLEAHVALYLGIGLLGASVVASYAMAYSAVRAAGEFGAKLVLTFADVWDDQPGQARRTLINISKSATTYSRLVLMSVQPTIMFMFGVVYLYLFNPILSLAMLTIVPFALMLYIPVDNMSGKLTKSDFDTEIDSQQLTGSPVVRRFMMAKLENFMARRFIASSVLGLLFVLIFVGLIIFGPERIVGLFNEQVVVVLVIIRASVLSLNRVAMCLRMANKKRDDLHAVRDICSQGIFPATRANAGANDEDDEEDF